MGMMEPPSSKSMLKDVNGLAWLLHPSSRKSRLWLPSGDTSRCCAGSPSQLMLFNWTETSLTVVPLAYPEVWMTDGYACGVVEFAMDIGWLLHQVSPDCEAVTSTSCSRVGEVLLK